MSGRVVAIGLFLTLLVTTAAVTGATDVIRFDGALTPTTGEQGIVADTASQDADGRDIQVGRRFGSAAPIVHPARGRLDRGGNDEDLDRADSTGPETLADLRDIGEVEPSRPDLAGRGLRTTGLAGRLEADRLGDNPPAWDTDADGLTNDVEVNDLGTDPLAADTDGDGLDDAAEIRRYGTDPLQTDTDGDGLSDAREVRSLDTDPTAVDTDDDGLTDAREVENLSTDPTARDTDGDGLPDGVEAATDGPLADADPLRMDVFVEVDYMTGHKPSPAAIDQVEAAFAMAPIDNPDGTTGVSLHVVVDDQLPAEPRTRTVERWSLKREHHDHAGQGYHYAVAVVDVRDGDRDLAGNGLEGTFLYQVEADGERYTTAAEAYLFMHELGHALGLRAADYRGIDARTVPFSRYKSVMNYNAPKDYLGYHDGPPFDDWEHLEHHLYTPHTIRLVD